MHRGAAFELFRRLIGEQPIGRDEPVVASAVDQAVETVRIVASSVTSEVNRINRGRDPLDKPSQSDRELGRKDPQLTRPGRERGRQGNHLARSHEISALRDTSRASETEITRLSVSRATSGAENGQRRINALEKVQRNVRIAVCRQEESRCARVPADVEHAVDPGQALLFAKKNNGVRCGYTGPSGKQCVVATKNLPDDPFGYYPDGHCSRRDSRFGPSTPADLEGIRPRAAAATAARSRNDVSER